MLLQSGQPYGNVGSGGGAASDYSSCQTEMANGVAAAAAAGTAGKPTTDTYLDVVQDSLKEGWSVHATQNGRLYYCK